MFLSAYGMRFELSSSYCLTELNFKRLSSGSQEFGFSSTYSSVFGGSSSTEISDSFSLTWVESFVDLSNWVEFILSGPHTYSVTGCYYGGNSPDAYIILSINQLTVGSFQMTFGATSNEGCMNDFLSIPKGLYGPAFDKTLQ